MQTPTPTSSPDLPLALGRFATLADGLDYAARGQAGFNYYGVRGELKASLPYSALRERALSAARSLLRLDVPRGSRVALIAETSPAFHTLFFGCQYAGLVPVPLPLPVNLGGREGYVRQLRRMMEAGGAQVAVGPAELVDILREAAEPLAIPHVGAPEDFLSLAGTEGGDPVPLGPDELCYIQYSSGSTSAPKGVMVTQRSATANANAIMLHGLEVRPGDRCVSWLPLYHDMGLVGFCLVPMLSQLSVDYLSTMDFARRPLLWLQLIALNGGTLSFSPSFGYDLCARRAATAPANVDLSSWRAAGIGGDMVRPEVLTRFAETFAPNGFRRSAFVPSYGLAESTLAVSFVPIDSGFEVDLLDREALAEGRVAAPAPDADPEQSRAFVRCGISMPDHEIRIADDAGRAVADGAIGRVLVRGPSVMAGYFGNPELTASALSPEGWLDTGDLGYLGRHGSLVITGRSKDLIIQNGRNIWPQDIEWSVERLPGLRQGDAAAFSVPGLDGGEAVVVAVQCRLSEVSARDRLKHQISATVRNAVGVDCTVVLVPPHSLPLTSSGKLSRAATRANYLAGRYSAPARELPQRLAAEA